MGKRKVVTDMDTEKGGKPVEKNRNLNPVLFLVLIMIAVTVLSYVAPAGSYDRIYVESVNREIVNPESFHNVEPNPIGLFTLLISVTQGMQKAANIIFFLFIVGGMFAILEGTGAIRAGMANVVRIMRGKELLMIPVCMTAFGCGSAFCANYAEYLAFVPLVLAVCLTMGFDSITAMGIIFCAAASGYAGAITNAFTTGIAQSIAGLPMFSGMGLRILLFITLITVSSVYVMAYAHRVKKNPELSTMYEQDKRTREEVVLDVEAIPHISRRQKAVLAVFVIGISIMVGGIILKGFNIDELSAVFLAIGIIGGVAGGLGAGELCDHFLKGCGNMLLPCLMVGLANSIVVLLEHAHMMDPVIHGLTGLLDGLPASMAACGMFIVQDLFNLVVSSGSGQAAITMPIMVPLADMLGLTRQSAVLAFQMGDAFTNVMSPAGPVIMAALAMCGGISIKKWLKWLLPLFIIWWIIAFAFMIIAVETGYGPF